MTIPDKWPQSCVGCGSCTEMCLQQIDIPGIMKDFATKLGARS